MGAAIAGRAAKLRVRIRILQDRMLRGRWCASSWPARDRGSQHSRCGVPARRDADASPPPQSPPPKGRGLSATPANSRQPALRQSTRWLDARVRRPGHGFGDLQLLKRNTVVEMREQQLRSTEAHWIVRLLSGHAQTRKMKPWPAIAGQGQKSSAQGQVNRCGFASAINLNVELQLITFVQAG